jgi:hypothetical protein
MIPKIEDVMKFLIEKKGFTPGGALKAAKAYIETREFVEEERIKYIGSKIKHQNEQGPEALVWFQTLQLGDME